MAYDMIAVIQDAMRRRKQVLAMRRRNMTFEQIGDQLGVTRQRAHSIWKEALRTNGNGSGK